LLTLYSGFQEGVHVSWPARDWATEPDLTGCRTYQGKCPSFDPRIRNWYVAASSGPKNLVIILDVSGSMGDLNRINLAKSAAKSVLDTLTFADYVNVIEVRVQTTRIFSYSPV
jgi:hypothetical protein